MNDPSILPELVEVCPICNGAGEYRQTYTAGCGMGTYRALGPCDYCKHPSKFMKGLGYRMKDGGEVPLSVINQIEIAMERRNGHDNG